MSVSSSDIFSVAQREKKLCQQYLKNLTGRRALFIGFDSDFESSLALSNISNCYYASGFLPGASGVSFDSQYWPFKEQTFNVIVLNYALAHAVQSLGKMLIEVKNCLTEGGFLVLIDHQLSFSGIRYMRAQKKLTHHFSQSYIHRCLVEQNFSRRFCENVGCRSGFWFEWLYSWIPGFAVSYVTGYKKITVPLTPFQNELVFEKLPQKGLAVSSTTSACKQDKL